MSDEAIIVYEISVYEPAVREELTGALELLLRRKGGLLHFLRHGPAAHNARNLAGQLMMDAQLAHQAMPGSIAVQFWDAGVKVANDAPIPYAQLTAVAETAALYVLAFGERIIPLQKRDCIRDAAVSLAVFLEEQTGIKAIYYE